jgi:hypothetical protein
MLSVHDEITLELSRLQRAAFENVRKRAASQQLGECWVDLIPADVDEASGHEPVD